jgi:predicted RNase H-like HicB family nuclease
MKTLPGCHAQGRDRGEAALRFQQAAKAQLEALLETGRPIPRAFRDKFVLTA